MTLANDDGTSGLAVGARARRPLRSLVSTSGTSKALSIWAAVPLTGMSRPSVDVAPRWSPTEPSQARTAANVAGVGPNTDPNWPLAR